MATAHVDLLIRTLVWERGRIFVLTGIGKNG
jgi:hypothetical protein